MLIETTSAGWGDGASGAPRKDWLVNRLGPHPPEAMEKIRAGVFNSVLAACGTPPSMFISDDGTAQREAVRRWHMNLVIPMAKILEHELTEKLEAEVSLKFDTYALDMVSRAQVVAKLAQAGVPMTTALSAVGIAE